jgi:hypothetical protein
MISVNGPLCRSWNSRLIVCALDWGRCTQETLDCVYRVLKWSFQIMIDNIWPAMDHTGHHDQCTQAIRLRKMSMCLHDSLLQYLTRMLGVDWQVSPTSRQTFQNPANHVDHMGAAHGDACSKPSRRTSCRLQTVIRHFDHGWRSAGSPARGF